MVEQAAIILGPALALGLIIGIYEVIIIHRDVTVPTHRFGHSIHAIILSMIFTFSTMNVGFVFSVIPALANIPLLGTPLMFRIALGLVAAVKVHAVSRVIKSTVGGGGLGETWFHSILIGGLITLAPYIYPFIAPILPAWVNF